MEEQESSVVEETVRIDNPVDCEITIGDRVYTGRVTFARFTFPMWRKWRKAIRDKEGVKELAKLGYDADEREAVISYWSGAAVLEEWSITCKDGDSDPVLVPAPAPGVPPPDDLDFEIFMWFRRVANNYIVPRLGMYPKS